MSRAWDDAIAREFIWKVESILSLWKGNKFIDDTHAMMAIADAYRDKIGDIKADE